MYYKSRFVITADGCLDFITMAHIHEKIDFTVEVFIIYKNTVLLRKHDKLGIWLSVGGHIELNEDPNQAAHREVKEEVGLDIVLCSPRYVPQIDTKAYKELIPPFFLDKQQYSKTHQHVTLVYIATTKSNNIIQPQTHEKSECMWVTKEELRNRQDIKDQIKYYASFALDVVTPS